MREQTTGSLLKVDSLLQRLRAPPNNSCSVLLAALLSLFVLHSTSSCTLVVPGGASAPPPSGSLSVSFIDVGQGDGILVQAGGQNYLIDAGRAEEGQEVVDFLRSRGVESLEGIVVSNPDADHIGGFPDVLDAFEVGAVYLSGDPKGTLSYNSFLRGVREEGSEMQEVRAGYRMEWGGVRADA
jgi:competence protein ComEC